MAKARTKPTAGAAMTTPAQQERLGEHRHKLWLQKSAERLESMLQHAAAEDLPYADFLEQVLGEEAAAKTAKNISMRTAMARFPFVKPLETFDFGWQAPIDKRQVLAGEPPLHRARRQCDRPGATRRRQDPSGSVPGHEGDRGGLPGAVCLGGASDRRPDQGTGGRQAGGETQAPYDAAAVDQRRDRLPAD